jgi:hypothetical protein
VRDVLELRLVVERTTDEYGHRWSEVLR